MGQTLHLPGFILAYEIGHRECHVRARGIAEPSFCRAVDVSLDVDRDLEREANVFAAELLMPEAAVRGARAEVPLNDGKLDSQP